MPQAARVLTNLEKYFINAIAVVGGGAVVMAMKGKNVPVVKKDS